MASIPVTGNAEADELNATHPLALLIGMLLDQQVPMEWAFFGPFLLHQRLGGLDAAAIAAMDPDEFLVVAKGPRAIHRFPKAMAARVQAACGVVAEQYGGDAEAIWRDVRSGDELLARLKALPGFGDEKSRIFIALLAKRLGVRPPGWEEAAAPFSDAEPRSVADVDSPESFAKVRAWKQERKRQGRSKQD